MKRKIFLLCISLCAGLLFSNRPVQATEITDEIVEALLLRKYRSGRVV